MGLVPGAGGGFANGVDKSYTLKPLVVGQLDLTNKVMEMSDQLAHNKSCPVWHRGSHGVDDSIGEVRVEAMPALVFEIGRLLCVWVHFGCVKNMNVQEKMCYQAGFRE